MNLFETTVDGRDLVRLDLNGKPAPDSHRGAARRPGYRPGAPWSSRMPLPEVAAGRADASTRARRRRGARPDTRLAGAHMVVEDLEEMLA